MDLLAEVRGRVFERPALPGIKLKVLAADELKTRFRHRLPGLLGEGSRVYPCGILVERDADEPDEASPVMERPVGR